MNEAADVWSKQRKFKAKNNRGVVNLTLVEASRVKFFESGHVNCDG